MKKFLLVTTMLMVGTTQVYAETFQLPLGVCVATTQPGQCGVLNIRSQTRMDYMAGRCKNGQLYGRVYKARSIVRQGNTITVDKNFVVTVKWVSPLKRSAKVGYKYVDSNGNVQTGAKSFRCN